MYVLIGNEITIENPTDKVSKWVLTECTFNNPIFSKKSRMGLSTWNTPKKINLYKKDGNNLIIPFGLIDRLIDENDIDRDLVLDTTKLHDRLAYLFFVPLKDWQFTAVDVMFHAGHGILQSKAGSGKTNMGLALAMRYNTKTLWLTHTHDLLNQSYERACSFCDKSLLGTITEGKVNIGKAITFATVQTMCNLDLLLYRDMFDVIIVDEVHRVAMSDKSFTQFQKVLENLSCLHKYGLSATVHRADDLIRTTFALVGNIEYVVPDEDVADLTCGVKVQPVITPTRLDFSDEYTKTDGTIDYTRLITYLANDYERNDLIYNYINQNRNEYCLVLGARLEQLRFLKDQFDDSISAIVDGTMTSKRNKARREQAINDMREGKKHILFATYKLAKEGLDIPRLNRLFLITPEKDSTTIIQALGRIGRVFAGKQESIAFDFVDHSRMMQRYFKERCRIYKKEGYEIEDISI